MNRVMGQSDMHDAELVVRAQSGDASAFGLLVSRYQERVYNTCYRMCHNDADAADLTQSAFLKAYEALPRFEARANFFTWLFRIAVNLTISMRRSALRRPRLVMADGPDGADGPALDFPGDAERDDPRRGALAMERRQQVEAALEQLDDEFRAAVILKDIEDLDYATIAKILEVPVGTVKSRIHRGRLMLKQLLTDESQDRGCA